MRSLALLIVLALRANALCYYPDGTPAPGDVPCSDSTQNAVCCGTGYACLSNGICQATGDELQKPGASEFVRGSCTDKTFRSSSCPSFCGAPGVDNVSGGEGMAKCKNTKQDLYWCINQVNIDLQQTQDPCENANAVVFFPGTPTALTTIGVPQKSTTSTTTSTPTTMSTTTSSSSRNTNTAATTGTSTPTSTSSPPAETTETSNGSKSNGGVIGGAVGGSLGGAAVIGILAFLFVRRRRGNRDSGIHEMDYTPVEPKTTSSSPLVHHPSTPHSANDVGPVHEAPGSTQFESAKNKYTPDEPMELPA
ncbi:hypothetical protein V8C42DRAFT_330312 [Trichoderma barbatum]